jgi:hypothetical protein
MHSRFAMAYFSIVLYNHLVNHTKPSRYLSLIIAPPITYHLQSLPSSWTFFEGNVLAIVCLSSITVISGSALAMKRLSIVYNK